MPIAWSGTMTQYAGRLQRHHAAKRDIRMLDHVSLADLFATAGGRRFAPRGRLGFPSDWSPPLEVDQVRTRFEVPRTRMSDRTRYGRPLSYLCRNLRISNLVCVSLA